MAARRRETYIFATELNKKPHHFFRNLLIVLLLLFLTCFVVNVIYSHSLVYERVPVTVPNLPEELENFSILHLSDLHGRKGMGSAIRKALGSRVYSCVVMTGDMLGKNGELDGLLEVLDVLPDNIPRFLIPGDEDPEYLDVYAHSGITAYADWVEVLQKKNVILLDEPYLMTRGRKDQARIWIVPEDLYTISLDSMEITWQGVLSRVSGTDLTEDRAAQKRVAEYQLARVQRIREAIRSMQSDDIQVAVSHLPLDQTLSETLVSWSGRNDVFSLRQAAVALAGHYCAGQWRLPGVGAIYVPAYGWFPEDSLIQGRSYVGQVCQYISPGIGASSIYPLPFRLFNAPVISSVELTRKMVD